MFSLWLVIVAYSFGETPTKSISIIWENTAIAGEIKVDRGALASPTPKDTRQTDYAFPATTRLELKIARTEENTALPTLVTVATQPRGFTFRLDDVDAAYPISCRTMA
jgi:hypothetical protein